MSTESTTGHDRDAYMLMTELFAMKDQRWLDENAVLKLADQLNLREDEKRIYFLREFLGIARNLPPTVFEDADEQHRLKDAIQAAMDTAIDAEEES